LRNSSDEALKLVKKTKGFIGIGLAGSFLGHEPSEKQHYLDQITYAVRMAGVDRVGIGSDFGGVTSHLPKGLESISDFEHLAPELPRGALGENLFSFIKSSQLPD
jgi:microsomal dipeptidase-like Zn-dependent dipeptidase